MNELEKLTQLAEKYNVLSVAEPLIKNPKFAQWSGSSKPFQHHYGKGGLIRHTLEVVELCIQINEYYGNPVLVPDCNGHPQCADGGIQQEPCSQCTLVDSCFLRYLGALHPA